MALSYISIASSLFYIFSRAIAYCNYDYIYLYEYNILHLLGQVKWLYHTSKWPIKFFLFIQVLHLFINMN